MVMTHEKEQVSKNNFDAGISKSSRLTPELDRFDFILKLVKYTSDNSFCMKILSLKPI